MNKKGISTIIFAVLALIVISLIFLIPIYQNKTDSGECYKTSKEDGHTHTWCTNTEYTKLWFIHLHEIDEVNGIAKDAAFHTHELLKDERVR